MAKLRVLFVRVLFVMGHIAIEISNYSKTQVWGYETYIQVTDVAQSIPSSLCLLMEGMRKTFSVPAWQFYGHIAS